MFILFYILFYCYLYILNDLMISTLKIQRSTLYLFTEYGVFGNLKFDPMKYILHKLGSYIVLDISIRWVGLAPPVALSVRICKVRSCNVPVERWRGCITNGCPVFRCIHVLVTDERHPCLLVYCKNMNWSHVCHVLSRHLIAFD